MKAGASSRGWAGWAVVVAVAAAAAGCTSSTAASSSGLPVSQGLCPATPQDTIGAACGVAGLRCGPAYMCGSLQVTLLCVCTGGTFQCTDGAGQQLDSAESVTCPAPVATGTCPASERIAQLASCGEQGLLCSYPSTCPSTLDQCQCSPGTTAAGGFGLRFECRPATCAGEGGVTMADAGHDARAPSDATADAPTTDATPGADADAGMQGDADAAPGIDADFDSPVDASSDGDAPSE